MNWLDWFKKEGYTVMIMPKKSESKFYASKNPKKNKSGDFRADSTWDEFKLYKDEIWEFPKGIFIDLSV